MAGMSGFYSINVVLLAYILGSVPTGYLVGMLWRKDPREIGSGNPGSANIFRFISPWAGLLNLFLDVGKGYLAVFLAGFVAEGSLVPFLAAVAAVSGHNWMLFLKFRGGKGLAASLGALLYLLPAAIPVIFALTAVLAVLLRDSNTAAATGILFLPLCLFYVFGWPEFLAGILWAVAVMIKFWPDFLAYKSGRRCLF